MEVDEYLNKLDSSRKQQLSVVRKMIKQNLPELNESFHYNMPTYCQDKSPVLAIASQKNYISFYVMNYSLLNDFKTELKKYNPGKSCIRFKKIADEEIFLLERILNKIKNYYFQK